MPQRGDGTWRQRKGQMSRGSALLGEPAGPAETRFAGKHDGLITVLDAELVEHPGDVVANGFLRKPERHRDLRVVEALGDTFEHRPLARGQLIERQSRTAGRGGPARVGEYRPQLVDQAR